MKITHQEEYITTKDYLVSGEEFTLVYDSKREMLITVPQPTESNLSKYYESKAYISHTDSKKGLVDTLYQLVKKRALQRKTKLLFSLQKEIGSVLDIGAGTGDFLKSAQDRGWDTYGVEPNENARNLAASKSIALKDSLDDFSNQKFNVITLWHVLEHVPDLEETIQKIENLLAPNGTLIIAVPNYKSFDANYYKSYWAAFDVPRHLWHFSKASMKILFSRKVKHVSTRPMIFDSFYVSLLSEKNKKNNLGLVRAFFIGFWSNISALKTKEYSSHIYCFKKSE